MMTGMRGMRVVVVVGGGRGVCVCVCVCVWGGLMKDDSADILFQSSL